MKIKVCGNRDPEAIQSIASLEPDYMGFLFYPDSPRHMENVLRPLDLQELPGSIEKVGVFVNEEVEVVPEKAQYWGLDMVQIHGDESPAYFAELKKAGLRAIKVFRVEEKEDLAQMDPYVPYCEMFLFDTKGKVYGGTGRPFDHSILEGVDVPLPFLLSGGISHLDGEVIRSLGQPALAGVDINSRFEIEPGSKDPERVQTFIEEIRRGPKKGDR